MSDIVAAEYAELLKSYRDLADGVRMIRRAVERAFHAGVLPPVEREAMTPLQECEAIARAIYAAAVKQKQSGDSERSAVPRYDDLSY
jgi:uncharacterized hydantoinase/oxoprolinase family protein